MFAQNDPKIKNTNLSVVLDSQVVKTLKHHIPKC